MKSIQNNTILLINVYLKALAYLLQFQNIIYFFLFTLLTASDIPIFYFNYELPCKQMQIFVKTRLYSKLLDK